LKSKVEDALAGSVVTVDGTVIDGGGDVEFVVGVDAAVVEVTEPSPLLLLTIDGGEVVTFSSFECATNATPPTIIPASNTNRTAAVQPRRWLSFLCSG
jgi:hypothetical protein